jgi:hypothetical protein
MDLEQERERQRRSYRFCWIGFSLMTLSLLIASFFAIGSLLLIFTGPNPHLGHLLGIKEFEFLIDTGRTWPRLLSAFFLWAAWGDVSWRRRSGLLVMMSLADALLWSIEHGVLLGVLDQPIGHDVLRQSLSMVLRWSEFVLIAGLATDFSQHIGAVNVEEFGKASRSTVVFGAVTWFLFFINRVDWSKTWPLAERRWTTDLFFLYLGYWVILSICLVQVCLLCLLACRSASVALHQMRGEDQGIDPWATASS